MKQTISLSNTNKNAEASLKEKELHDKEYEALRSLNEALKEASASLRDALEKAEKKPLAH